MLLTGVTVRVDTAVQSYACMITYIYAQIAHSGLQSLHMYVYMDMSLPKA